MHITVTHKFHFTAGRSPYGVPEQNFVVPELNKVIEAPDWIREDPLFGMAKADGHLQEYTLPAEAQAVAPNPAPVPVVEPTEPSDEG